MKADAAPARQPGSGDAPDDWAAIGSCFMLPRGVPIVLDARALNDIGYLLRQIHASPRKVTHGPEHKALREHVRGLIEILPGLIAAADAEAAAAGRDGRTTDMGHFAWRAWALLDAAQPFAAVVARGRDPRSWWHGGARLLAMEVQAILRQHQQPAGVQKDTSPAIIVVVRLLALAGVTEEPGAVIEALRARQSRVKKT